MKFFDFPFSILKNQIYAFFASIKDTSLSHVLTRLEQSKNVTVSKYFFALTSIGRVKLYSPPKIASSAAVFIRTDRVPVPSSSIFLGFNIGYQLAHAWNITLVT